ncbi:hypothetical protein BVRB_8g195580 [Beta vulgaris subsp. vulgaris]|nr:hypothetical protein BVRB_8g195580 [Beta vulgaris subsp. vulgaris]
MKRKDAFMQPVLRCVAAFVAMKPANAASISSAVAVKQKLKFEKETVCTVICIVLFYVKQILS